MNGAGIGTLPIVLSFGVIKVNFGYYMMLTVGMLTCFFLSVFLFGICKSVITGTAFIICMASFSCIIIKMLSNEKKSYDPDSCDFFVNRKETDEQKSSLLEQQ